MATEYSKNVKATLGTDTILYVTELSLTGIGKEFEDIKVFGDDYYSSFDTGFAPVTGSMTFVQDLADSTGQAEIESASISGTKITDFRIYISASDYWTSDTVTDTKAGVYFTNFTPAPATSATIKASVDFKFVGAYHRTS